MTKDRILSEFVDTYDRTMMESVENISKEFGLVIHNHTIDVNDINEAKNNFCEFVNDFTKYKMNETKNTKNVSLDEIRTHTKNMVTTEMFNTAKWRYKDLPAYVESYVNLISEVDKFVEECRVKLFEYEANQDDIGFLTEATELFYDTMKSKFDSSMDKILTASGYKSKKAISEKTKSPIFL